MKIKILVSGYHIGTGKGAERVTKGIIQELSRQRPDYNYTILVRKGAALEAVEHSGNIVYQMVDTSNNLDWYLNKLPRWSQTLNSDYVVIPGESPILFMPKPYLLLMHEVPEVVRLVRGANHTGSLDAIKRYLTDWLRKRACHKAEKVLTISQNTARDVERTYGVNSKNIEVAYPGGAEYFSKIDKSSRVSLQKKWNAPHGFVLATYTGDTREKTETVLNAFTTVVDAVAQDLFIVGCPQNRFQSVQSSLTSKGLINRCQILPYVSDYDLKELYAACDVFVELSMYEGFGLQVMEAMASGALVVASNNSSIPEITRNAASLVNPLDINGVANALKLLLNLNDTDADILRDHATRTVSHFTWENFGAVVCSAVDNMVR